MIDETKLINELCNCFISMECPDGRGINDMAISAYDEGIYDAIHAIEHQPKINEWIPCSEMLPENSKHKGAFCPRYEVNTKYGFTQGWYNPDVESWYCLFWFLLGIYDENDINFERGDIPKVVKISKNTDIVTAWKPLPEPWEGEK